MFYLYHLYFFYNMESTQITKPKRIDFGKRFLKMIILIIILISCLEVVKIMFQWNNVDQLPQFLRVYAPFLLTISPYLRYLNAFIVLILGYFLVGELGQLIYAYMRGFADHSSAATIQNITRIVGYGIILATLASIYSVDPTIALTFGGFGGLVVGFATQTFLSNTIAGIFILMTRPFTFGDVVTMAGNTGTVKEIRLTHLVMESIDNSKDIMIPNNLILSQIILKNRPGKRMGPIPTKITLDPLPVEVKVGEKVTVIGRLVESVIDKPLAQSVVKLFDRDVGRDDFLLEGNTDSNGYFTFQWIARKVDSFDDSAEVYVKFEGDEDHRSVNSKQYLIDLKL
jgi:small conductance mechanosensitive channel